MGFEPALGPAASRPVTGSTPDPPQIVSTSTEGYRFGLLARYLEGEIASYPGFETRSPIVFFPL